MTNPIATFQPQGRDTRNYQFIDTATYVTGDHTLQFGGSYQRVKVNPYNYAGRFPTITFGFSAAAPASVQLSATQFPGGISANDLATANAHLAYLAGIVSQVAQTFQVEDATSGFVAGYPRQPQLDLQQQNVYIQDNWRAEPGLTIRGGIKWEYFSPLREDDNLLLLPVQASGQSTLDALLNPERHRRLRQRRDVRRRPEQLRADRSASPGIRARTAGPRCAAPTRWPSSTRTRSPSRATRRSATRA